MNEIGPRFVLNPIKIFEGSFCGAVIYENEGEAVAFVLTYHLSSVLTFVPMFSDFISPQAAKDQLVLAKASKYRGRKMQDDERQERRAEIEALQEDDPLEGRKVFA